MRHPTALAGLAVFAMLLGACTAQEPAETVPVTSPGETVPVTPPAGPLAPLPDDGPADAEAPFGANLQPDTAELGDGARLSPIDMRFGVHEGFDRIVLDLDGTGLPGWNAQYVDTPTEQGSGFEVELAGSAFLEVAVTGVQYPTEEGAREYAGPSVLRPEGAGVVEEIQVGGIFEGYQQLFIGLRSQQPFRVFRLEEPPRVVIDVQHP